VLGVVVLFGGWLFVVLLMICLDGMIIILEGVVSVIEGLFD